MEFKDFIQKLSSVISAGVSTDRFTKSVLASVLTEEGQDILEEYKSPSYKSFFNGHTSIRKISKKINGYLEPENFTEYIGQFPDGTVDNLCSVFRDDLPDIDLFNAGEKLAALLVSIITEAAGTKKKGTPKDAVKNDDEDFPLGGFMDVAPELTPENAGRMYFFNPDLFDEDEEEDEIEDCNPFQKYLDESVKYYSTKKTLLYAENPHPFYELYVSNDICYRKFRITGARDIRTEKYISDVTLDKLEAESNYIIIQGIGGIGKSMMLTHLFLSSASETEETGITPLFLMLQNYKDTTCGMIDFIWSSLKESDPNISQGEIVKALQNRRILLLLDGLDEIQSSARVAFNQDLEAFIKAYPGNTVIMTSRPINSFVSYSKFSLFDIQPLTKKQAIQLVTKLQFWDDAAKKSFLSALNGTLYSSHYQFASNPLLLTIMLMTYSSFGEVPAKMHVFYAKAYETMARLHDATKGSYQRPLHTGLTPEEFAKYFSQFCARTYKDEVLEFDLRIFTAYMTKVLKSVAVERRDIQPRDFLLDLTDNLCIMYREGDQYYFIHRSFQEYFAAVYFSSEYDAKLEKVGIFFENMKHRSYSDRTFDMFYDMIPEKVERFIFLPYLDKLFSECAIKGEDEEYWEFLERIYPVLYYEEGNVGDTYSNEPNSFLYQSIVESKRLEARSDFDDFRWPKEIRDLPTREWTEAYSEFLEYEAFDAYPNPCAIPENILEAEATCPIDELPYKYREYFGEPDVSGITIEIEIYELRKNPYRYTPVRKCMELAEFPLMREFQNVKHYYIDLKKRTQLEVEADDLFDD